MGHNYFISYVIPSRGLYFGSMSVTVNGSMSHLDLVANLRKLAEGEAEKFFGKKEDVVLLCISKLED